MARRDGGLSEPPLSSKSFLLLPSYCKDPESEGRRGRHWQGHGILLPGGPRASGESFSWYISAPQSRRQAWGETYFRALARSSPLECQGLNTLPGTRQTKELPALSSVRSGKSRLQSCAFLKHVRVIAFTCLARVPRFVVCASLTRAP